MDERGYGNFVSTAWMSVDMVNTCVNHGEEWIWEFCLCGMDESGYRKFVCVIGIGVDKGKLSIKNGWAWIREIYLCNMDGVDVGNTSMQHG